MSKVFEEYIETALRNRITSSLLEQDARLSISEINSLVEYNLNNLAKQLADSILEQFDIKDIKKD
jgi:hypothetical protein